MGKARHYCLCCGKLHELLPNSWPKVYVTLTGPQEHMSERDGYFYVFAADPHDREAWLKGDQQLQFPGGVVPKPPLDGSRAQVGWICGSMYQVSVRARSRSCRPRSG